MHAAYAQSGSRCGAPSPPAAPPDLGTPQAPDRPLAIVAEFDGIIHPISAEYLIETLNQADTAGADVVVFILRTPGGLLDSTRAIVSRMIASRAPVVVFVGPSGLASGVGRVRDHARGRRGRHGTRDPHRCRPPGVRSRGKPSTKRWPRRRRRTLPPTRASLAAARGRNLALAEEAVLESRAFTDGEALQATPPLIDFRAQDLDDVLRQLDGRTITRFDGRTTTLRTTNAEVRRVDMTRRQEFLGAIAHPQIATLLLTLGMLGLTIELWNPGAIIPGVAGGLCLLLAFFAFQILPVSTTGLLLILFGLVLLLLEFQVPSFGALGIGGTVSLVLGSTMLTRETIPGIEVSLGFIVPLALSFAAITLFLGRLAVASQRRSAVTGVDGMIGVGGRARDVVGPDESGNVDIHGEIWRAQSASRIAAGQPVRITAVDGLTLTVEPSGASAQEGED